MPVPGPPPEDEAERYDGLISIHVHAASNVSLACLGNIHQYQISIDISNNMLVAWTLNNECVYLVI